MEQEKEVEMKRSVDYRQEHELLRRELWSRAWTYTASANDCKSTKTATVYADAALEAFDNRFKPLA